MAIETDRCRFLAGVRHGVDARDARSPSSSRTATTPTGSKSMSPEPLPDGQRQPAPLTIPRPGHADFAGMAKYGHDDMRNVLERASARETVGRVAGGAVCKRLLAELGVTVRGRVTAIGAVPIAGRADLADPQSIDWEAVEASPVGCERPRDCRSRMCEAIDQARAAGESLGGVFEVWCWGSVPGSRRLRHARRPAGWPASGRARLHPGHQRGWRSGTGSPRRPAGIARSTIPS